MNPLTTAAILGNWAKVADLVAESHELPSNGRFEWKLTLDGGRDSWDAEEREDYRPCAMGMVQIVEYDKVKKIQAIDMNLCFLEDGAYPKGYHNPVSIEEMAKAIVVRLAEDIESRKIYKRR